MAIATASASYAMSPRQRVAALEQRRLAHRTSQLYQFQRQEQQLADLQDICGRLRRDPPSERDDVAPVVAKVQRHLQEVEAYKRSGDDSNQQRRQGGWSSRGRRLLNERCGTWKKPASKNECAVKDTNKTVGLWLLLLKTLKMGWRSCKQTA
eukprot:GHVT01078954.1.p1 GENE.GHVT01078954.1~~GHVT01078954.1.p1  ORF type:complete len:152 (-),score=34.86 GHVT01078954.1:708-1163(-)